MSHTWAFPSVDDAVTTSRPSGLNATVLMGDSCRKCGEIGLPLVTSHIHSALPQVVTSHRPSSLTAAAEGWSHCLKGSLIIRFVRPCHTRTALSPDTVATQ